MSNQNDDEYFVLDEGFLDKPTFNLIKNWKMSNEANRIKKFKSTSVTPEEASELKEEISIMKTDDISYAEYKKAFHKFCTFIHTIDKGVILKTIKLDKNKTDDNFTLYVEYADNTKKIELPDDCKLYHITKVSGIKKLIPFFKGKSAKGYLYDKPRIYFTIRKKMPKFLADYKVNEKMYTYECQKDIKEVYIDPLVPSFIQGAVYIETPNPVPVEEVGMKAGSNNENEVEAKNEAYEESLYDDVEFVDENTGFDFDSFFDMIMESGLELAEDQTDYEHPVDDEDEAEEIGDEEEWEYDNEGIDVEDIDPKSGMPSPNDVVQEGIIPALIKKHIDKKQTHSKSETKRIKLLKDDDLIVTAEFDDEAIKERDAVKKKIDKEAAKIINDLNKNQTLISKLEDAIFDDLCPFDRNYMANHPEMDLPDPSKKAKAKFVYTHEKDLDGVDGDIAISVFDKSIQKADFECEDLCEKYNLMHDPTEYECDELNELSRYVVSLLCDELIKKLGLKNITIVPIGGLNFIEGLDFYAVKRYGDLKDKNAYHRALEKKK